MEKKSSIIKSIIRHKLKEIDKKWASRKIEGPSKSKALESASGKIKLKQPRRLTPEESREKTKHWPKGGEALGNMPSEEYRREHQRRTGRAYSE